MHAICFQYLFAPPSGIFFLAIWTPWSCVFSVYDFVMQLLGGVLAQKSTPYYDVIAKNRFFKGPATPILADFCPFLRFFGPSSDISWPIGLKIATGVGKRVVVNMDMIVAMSDVTRPFCDVIIAKTGPGNKNTFWGISHDWNGLEQKFKRFWKAYNLSFTHISNLYSLCD